MGEKRKNKDRLCTILMIVFFSILAILVILPIYTIFLASFKPGGDLLQYGLNLGIDWSRMSLDNYVLLFTGQHDYWRWFFNSITLTVVTVVATLLVSAFVGYGFAAYESKERTYVRNRSPDFICSTGGYHASAVQTDDNMGTDG